MSVMLESTAYNKGIAAGGVARVLEEIMKNSSINVDKFDNFGMDNAIIPKEYMSSNSNRQYYLAGYKKGYEEVKNHKGD